MSAKRHLRDLSIALRMTEQMLGLAKDEAWDELNSLEAERQGLVRAAFTDPVPLADASSVAEIVGRIQSLNQQLVALSGQRRDRIADALGTLATGRRARSAYGNASGT